MLRIVAFQGICRIHKTPWEHPVGQQVNPLVIGFSHYSTTNDCAIYIVKGAREKPLQSVVSDQYAREEFVLDMDRAYGIVKDAFGDVKREALEMSIVSYKEVLCSPFLPRTQTYLHDIKAFSY